MVAVVAAVGLGIVALARLLPDGGADDETAPAPAAVDGVGGEDSQPTVLLATFDEQDPSRGASLIAVLGYDRPSEAGTILFIPATTLADVPGHGLLQVGRAYGFGQGPLLDATLDNLLEIDLDSTVSISRQGWAALLGRIGGLTIDVPNRLDQRLEDGSAEVRFRPGEQFLDGPRLAELLLFDQGDESELQRLPRAQLVITALLQAIADDPAILDPVFTDGAPMLDTTAEPETIKAFLLDLARSTSEARTDVRTLPVSPIGSGEDNSYRIDRERADQLIADRLSDSVPTGRTTNGRSLQILNGNGQPGIGQDIATRLVPAGFKVVLTGNADRFDYDETRVLVYADDEATLASGRQIVDLLGVGRVELSRTPQSVVDITIVVGRDFPPPAG